MNLFWAMDILASGLTSQRVRMNVTASNLANANTTRGADGEPFRRLDPVFTASPVAGGRGVPEFEDALREVLVTEVVTDDSAPRRVYDPSHPHADPEGFVSYPNVNMVEEMVNMITAARAYEAGVTAMHEVADMADHALRS